MKTLYLLRHAKSSWKDTSLNDFDRPLNKRGMNDAPLIGKYLFDQKTAVDLIISSPAKRAALTAKIVADELKFTSNIIFEPKIYEANLPELLNLVHSIENRINNVFLIGHNPALNEFANYLVDREINNIPTAGAVAIRFEMNWKEISEKSGKLLFFIYPKKLKI